MKKGSKILSVELPQEVVQQIEEESVAPPFLGNRSAYTRSILENRHQKTIVAAAPTQALIEYYQQQLAQLALDHQEELDHQGQLHQMKLEQQQQWVADQDKEITVYQRNVAEYRQAYQQLQEELTELTVQHARGQFQQEEDARKLAKQAEKIQSLTLANEDFKKQRQQGDDIKQWGNLVNNLLENKTVSAGLGNLFGRKNKAQPASALQIETEIGQGIVAAFPGPELKVVLEFLSYLSEHPMVKAQLVAQPAFVAYQAKRRAADASQTEKSTQS